MQKVLFAAQMKEADGREIRRGTPSQILMERAAKAALSVLKREFDTARVLFLCGNGNNGGDGLAMARFLAEEGADVLVCCPLLHGDDPGREMSAEAARQYRLLPQNVMHCSAPFPEGITAVVDALFGIGLSRPIEGELAKILHQIREMAVPVLAVDIPSGVCADTGRVLGTALPAKHTVSMAAYKYGQLLYPGTTLCGKLTVADIGVPTDEASGKLLQREDLSLLPTRPARAHKGRFGRVLVIGGSVGMSGAAYFTAKAAYRAGAGLVEIFAPAENRIIYQTQLPEALLTLYDPRALDKSSLRQAIDRADAIAIGMGLGTEALTETLVECVLQRAKVPVLLDADALNCISCSPALFALLASCKCPRILTPHLGE
ncbi:MAG: NAD(P)H-hydrate epimerase, partial [Clostridia bacterium]|nr:NAD(P)H-hydrate epimerase [Clostridia bacterium]